MPIRSISNNISRTQKDISDLSRKISEESKKEARLSEKALRIQKSINNVTNARMLSSKSSEYQRCLQEIARVKAKKSDLIKKEADKNKKLLKYKQDLSREEERGRIKVEDQLNKQEKAQKRLSEEYAKITRTYMGLEIMKKDEENLEYDLFISHASEDKDEFVRPLVKALENLGVKVWYDELTLRVGDSLRGKIDQGLKKSSYGTVVLSSSFFSKSWTKYELNGMMAREMNGHKMILPIWHKVSKDEVLEFSPSIADMVALNSSMKSINEIAKELADIINPN